MFSGGQGLVLFFISAHKNCTKRNNFTNSGKYFRCFMFTRIQLGYIGVLLKLNIINYTISLWWFSTLTQAKSHEKHFFYNKNSLIPLVCLSYSFLLIEFTFQSSNFKTLNVYIFLIDFYKISKKFEV